MSTQQQIEHATPTVAEVARLMATNENERKALRKLLKLAKLRDEAGIDKSPLDVQDGDGVPARKGKR